MPCARVETHTLIVAWWTIGMSESASKRQRQTVEGEEHGLDDGHHEAVMDTDGRQQQQQQEATASHTTHTIDLEAFAQRFSQIPVVVAYVFSFVSLHLVAALPQRLWRHVGCQITQLVMDTYDTAERRFWCGLSFADAFEAAAATAAGRQAPTTLESIDIIKGESAIVVDEAEGRDIRAARERLAALPPALDPPLTLTSLRSITGVPGGYEPSYPGRGRHWQLPSLEKVQVRGMLYRGEMLGELVGTSRRLKELHVECHPDVMANSLAQIPVAAAGQPGLLSQLEDVGTLRMSSASARGLERLQAVLVNRGCRSIKKLKVTFEELWTDSSIFAPLSAIEAFRRAVCVSLDISVAINSNRGFDLSLLCDTPIRPEPSPFVQKHIQQLAANATTASFFFGPEHFATPGPLDTPSPAAIALAQSLTFPEAKEVVVGINVEELDVDADQPDPLVIDSMPHSAFPAASRLSIQTSEVHAGGRRLLTKMSVVKSIDLDEPTEADAAGVLEAVGGERELECFNAKWVTGVGEGGLTWGDHADQLPTITRLEASVEVPEDLGDGDAAGEFGIACVRSLLKIRGVKKLRFALCRGGGQSFRRLVGERTHRDTIGGLEGR
ncbi:unnamed protein product [Vitrella brassicaformis CCMP3155]|uniref:Uncharacterized protein n=1 Tax=Vitrella brassicaformis (strain CCMP3155) TaxID=1169540 RepID=A0A0G4ETW6_VITBC|nr:unnamed protein product [Vitrella brassicaformis CCMP3155]|eukprot:CEM01767.1 unnamed protein product [Vitrella brassicaformis CCMP3155]